MKIETLKDLGFKPVWPMSNPKEHWWKNEELGITFYEKPTVKQFYERLEEIYYKIGVEDTQYNIKKALGI
jgi:hypothetical protein